VRSCSSCWAIGRKLADATKACRIRRTRGETGPRRRLAVAARRRAAADEAEAPVLALPLPAFFDEVEFVAEGLTDLA